MKTRTLLAVAVTGALITGATAGGVIFHQHAQGVAAFDEARDKLAAKIETIETARGTAVADLAEAQHILDLASQPGALARTPALTDLDAAVSRATERMSAYDELLAGPQTALAEADSERDSLFWRSDFAEATAAMLSQVNLGSAAGVPELQLEAVAAAVEELERTTEIVATEKRITGTPAAQDSSGSYRPAVEKLISDAGFHVRRTTTEAAACGDQPIRGAAAAFVCPGSDDVWIVTGTIPDDDLYLDAAVRHELAHQMIFKRCGTPDPAEAGNQSEAVTSSYAVLYLGADRAELARPGEVDPAYAMTPESDAAARAIHDQGCAA
ncbi:hypothetical protein [Leucobacter aridicollis]|uniref:Uncharacterized protein n=1 Tax=Leucobacter aridicollis TaxID=283878 RepID=A0A852R626_9MICO|nr:hypothetical protein [Leucobacter aridicollis]MBL3682008.1 hypothetical protein [Leucobacter aridicollis]NYD26945.1 hypothetical protein [Leucobacter aridicollis]